MKQKDIFTHNLSLKEFNALVKAFDASNISIQTLKSISSAEDYNEKACAIFLGVDSSEALDLFQERINTSKAEAVGYLGM